MRYNLIIVPAVLIVMASSGPSRAYYTIDESCHQSGKLNTMDGAKETKASRAYYVYSNCGEFFGQDPNPAIFSPIRMAFVPVDQIRIEGHFNLNVLRNDGAPDSAENMLYANIALKNTYDEYRRLQQRQRDLLKGLEVPSFSHKEQLSQFAKGVSEGNNRSSQLRKSNGPSDKLRNKQLPSAPKAGGGGMVKDSPSVRINSSFNENQIHSYAARDFTTTDDPHPEKNANQSNLPNQGDSGKGENTVINIDHKASKNREGLSAIVWAILAVQESALANPQLIIVILLIAAMLISILRSNTRKR